MPSIKNLKLLFFPFRCNLHYSFERINTLSLMFCSSCGEKPGICSNPCAVISVTDPVRGSVLARGQKYRVVVDIEMPESPMNQRIGNEAKPFTSGVFRKATVCVWNAEFAYAFLLPATGERVIVLRNCTFKESD